MRAASPPPRAPGSRAARPRRPPRATGGGEPDEVHPEGGRKPTRRVGKARISTSAACSEGGVRSPCARRARDSLVRADSDRRKRGEHGPELEATPALALGERKRRCASSRCALDAHRAQGYRPRKAKRALVRQCGRWDYRRTQASSYRPADLQMMLHNTAQPTEQEFLPLGLPGSDDAVRADTLAVLARRRSPTRQGLPGCGACVGAKLDCTCWKTSASVRERASARIPTRAEGTRSRLREKATVGSSGTTERVRSERRRATWQQAVRIHDVHHERALPAQWLATEAAERPAPLERAGKRRGR
jgi:hypothetical protein